MSDKKQVCIMISVPEETRNSLRKMAAQENLKNLSKVTTASTIAREIVCNFLNTQEKNKETVVVFT